MSTMSIRGAGGFFASGGQGNDFPAPSKLAFRAYSKVARVTGFDCLRRWGDRAPQAVNTVVSKTFVIVPNVEGAGKSFPCRGSLRGQSSLNPRLADVH